jgi:alpha-tubulin suppressor-like RCC1 family protein
VVIAAVASGLPALVVACLPDIRFDGSSGSDAASDGVVPAADSAADGTDASSEAAPPADATLDTSDASPPTDAATDAAASDSDASSAPDAPDSSDAAGDAPDPNAIGAIADDLTGTSGLSARCAVHGGAVQCWGAAGCDVSGMIGLPVGDGGVAYPSPTNVPTVLPGSQITQIVMGARHSCTLYGRAAYCRGDDLDHQLGYVLPTGSYTTGEALVQGLPASGLDALDVAGYSTCGITLVPEAGAPSNVYCWGTNAQGALGVPLGTQPSIAASVTGDVDGGPQGVITDAVAIAGGGAHHCVISTSRGILCWGGTDYYECGPQQGPAQCTGGGESTCLDQPQPVALPGETPVALALGTFHSCALTASGNVYCWGWNPPSGVLGIGTPSLPHSCPSGTSTVPCTGMPMQVTSLAGIKRLRAGGSDTCAIDGSKHMYCWGYNGDGELGQSPATQPTTPVEILNGTGTPILFDDVAVGVEGVCGRSGDTLYCWGKGGLATSEPDAQAPPGYQPSPVLF